MKLLILSAAALLIPAAAIFAALMLAGRHDLPLRKPLANSPLPMPDGFPKKMARAIYLAEGGNKTRFPYGIKSLSVSDRNTARTICLKAIDRHWKLWSDDGQPGGFPRGFVIAMATHWCPMKTDSIGHTNWIRNVCWFLEHEK